MQRRELETDGGTMLVADVEDYLRVAYRLADAFLASPVAGDARLTSWWPPAVP